MIQDIIRRRFTLAIYHVLFISIFCLPACRDNSADNNNSTLPPLVYTKHARCRMECRHINEAEIKEVLAENYINQRKSNTDGKPCPTYAYEGYSKEHQHLRIVIAKCDNTWKVVTCIDLGNEFDCNCH